MAVLCRDLNLLYICIPKTGSTSVSDFLIKHAGGEWVPENSIFNSENEIIVDKKHSKIDDLLKYDILSEEYMKQLTLLASVRNPFDLVLSNYFFEKKIYRRFYIGIKSRTVLGSRFYFYVRQLLNLDQKNEYSWIMPQASRYYFSAHHTFTEYVQKYYSNKRSNLFLSYTGNYPCKFIKQESLENELESLLKKCGFEREVRLPRLSISRKKNRSYREFYTSEARNIVQNVFLDELQVFKYKF